MAASQNNIPPAEVTPVSAGKPYKVIGLKEADHMPVHYAGEKYDLAKLTDAQAETLIESGYPHLIKA